MVCGEFVAPPLSRSNRPRWGDTDRGQMAGGRLSKIRIIGFQEYQLCTCLKHMKDMNERFVILRRRQSVLN